MAEGSVLCVILFLDFGRCWDYTSSAQRVKSDRLMELGGATGLAVIAAHGGCENVIPHVQGGIRGAETATLLVNPDGHGARAIAFEAPSSLSEREWR